MKFVCISLLYVLTPPFLYIILGEKIDVVRDYFEFLSLYYGIGVTLLVCYLTLKEQKKQFEEEKKFQKEQFEKDKTLQKKEKLNEERKSCKSINIILKSLLKKEGEEEFLTQQFRSLYSFIFIASPTLYSKEYFFLSKRQLDLLEKSVSNVTSPEISKNIIDIISWIDDVETKSKNIIENSRCIENKVSFCCRYMSEFFNPSNNNIFIKYYIEKIFVHLISPEKLLNFDISFSSKEMIKKEKNLEIIKEMKELLPLFYSVHGINKEFIDCFIDCLNTMITMHSLVYGREESEICGLLSETSKMIDNKIKQIEGDLLKDLIKNDLV